jgi:ssDNA-binding Zn-finger/Zn-ribbon topoisomerase 1
MMMGEREPTERICPECDDVMRLVHWGRFSTLYVCPTCGSTLTLPPPEPLATPKSAPP